VSTRRGVEKVRITGDDGIDGVCLSEREEVVVVRIIRPHGARCVRDHVRSVEENRDVRRGAALGGVRGELLAHQDVGQLGEQQR
jgi:hypothetical protein